MFYDVEFCHVGSVACIPQQQIYHFHCKTIYKMLVSLVFICECVTHFDYFTVLQHGTSTQPQPLTKVVYRQELDQVMAVLARFTSVYLDSCVKTNYSLLDMLYSKWHVQYTPAIWPLHC